MTCVSQEAGREISVAEFADAFEKAFPSLSKNA
jgi:hypothetical protein